MMLIVTDTTAKYFMLDLFVVKQFIVRTKFNYKIDFNLRLQPYLIK